jgi:RNA polymerase sigma-70 factor (ECF subfamily)
MAPVVETPFAGALNTRARTIVRTLDNLAGECSPMVARAIRGPIAMDDADEALVERCKANDLHAFEELVRRYQTKIYNFVCKMTGDSADAEDIAQDVFVRVYQSVHRFRGESTFQTWVFRIAMNMCVDRSRRTQRRVPVAYSLDASPEEGAEDSAREIPDETQVPERLAERAELQLEVRRCLAGMSAKLRTVVILYDIQGLSYEEIAQTLRCPIGTVKSRLFNARAELGRRLQPYLENG